MGTQDWIPLEERPNWRPYEEPDRAGIAWWLLAALLVAAAGAAYYAWKQEAAAPALPTAIGPPISAPAPPQAETPAPQHPVPQAEAQPGKPLPALDRSDAPVGEWVAGLVGAKAFKSFVIPDQLVRRIVVTVDNLPRRIVPVRMRAVRPVPGKFAPNSGNRSRYEPYVKVFESLDARALVQLYVKLYPLLQGAYAEAGEPGVQFNDRVFTAIEDMLVAPELRDTPELAQPKVLYRYSDPALEGRSAGQKILMRLGAENAARVKAKLREIQRELTTALASGQR